MITVAQMKANKTLNLGLTTREAANYFVAEAIECAIDPKRKTFPYDVHQALAAKLGHPCRDAHSIFVPSTLNPRASGLDSKNNATGGYLTPTTIPDLVEYQWAQMVLGQLGATPVPNLDASVQFAKETASVQTVWTGQNPGSDVAESAMTFGAVTGTPYTSQGTITVSRQLVGQASRNIALEARLRKDVMRGHAQAFDAAAINGSGSSNQPTGILQNQNINIVSIGASGGAAAYSHICSLEEAVSNANVEPTGFLTTPTQRRKLRQVAINGTGSDMTWDAETNTMLGRPSFVSNNVPGNLSKGSGSNLSAIICGKWDELLLLEFGVVELVIDPYSKIRQGCIEISSFSMVDAILPRPTTFAIIGDAA